MQALAKAPVTFRHFDGEPGRQGNAIHVVNPSDKEWMPHRYLVRFGQIGCAFMLVYSHDPSDAIEKAAAFALDVMGWTGFVTPHSTPREDLGCDCEDPFDCDSHMYTESGWLSPEEVGITEDPSNDELRRINRG